MASTYYWAWHLRITGNGIYVLLGMTSTYYWAWHLRITRHDICVTQDMASTYCWAWHLRVTGHDIYVLLGMASTYYWAWHLLITGMSSTYYCACHLRITGHGIYAIMPWLCDIFVNAVQTFWGIIHVCQAILETGSGRKLSYNGCTAAIWPARPWFFTSDLVHRSYGMIYGE